MEMRRRRELRHGGEAQGSVAKRPRREQSVLGGKRNRLRKCKKSYQRSMFIERECEVVERKLTV